MHHYRQALLRMRQGDSDRDIADAKIMGRRKAGQWRALAQAHGWLDAQAPLPDDEAVAAALVPPKRASTTVSRLEEHRAKVASWVEQNVPGTAIHQALQRQHGWTGSYSAVRRMVAGIRTTLPPEVTCRLDFAPGEAAQVDFGAGPILLHPDGKPRRTWAFVMTLAHSRHQYLEFVWDQTVATWLGCHRRAFEWFAGVPERIVIDNAKCAITKACAQDPVVQRAYAECAEGYGFKIDPCPPHDPQKKGIVEAGVKYVKGNFLPLREFRDLAGVLAAAIKQQAGGRIRQPQIDGYDFAHSIDPTHTMVAKDANDHPLHDLAGSLAQKAVLDVGRCVADVWDGKATAASAIACASKYFKHPGYTAEFDEKVADWAESNKAAIVKASDQTSALKRAREHQHDNDGHEHQRTMPRQFQASWSFWTEHYAALTGRADVLTTIRKEGVA